MRDDEAGVERGADAVAGEIPDDAVAEPARVGLDHAPDRVKRPARRYRPDAPHHRFARALDEKA